MTIRIFPSALPGEPIETHEAAGTLHDWLVEHCPSYRPNGGDQPIIVTADGEQVEPAKWVSLDCAQDIEIRPKARGFDPITIAIIAFFAAAAVGLLLRPSIPRLGQNGRQGQSLQEAALTANRPKPNGVIPEIAGRHKVFPDYLVQPRRYFTSPTKQALDVLLCIGRGEFAINDDDIRIGETRIADLTDVAEFEIFGPGVSVSGSPAHRNWYNAPEVGSTTGSTGLRMTTGWLGPFRATPRNETSNLIEFDVFAPQGIGYINEGGSIDPRIKSWELQWRSNGGAWTAQTFSVQAATRDQCGYTFQVTLPSALSGVEVRIRRVDAEQTDLKSLDRLEWYGLRSLLPAPSSYAGVTTIALTITGSDAIASATENQINLIATRKINGVATRSIAAWVQHVCDDIGYGAEDLDADEIARLGAIWDARSDQFDFVFSDQATVRDALAMALRAGYSELTIDDGRIRPVRDEPRTTFEQIYTPQNMTAPLTRQFVSYDPDDHDGVDVEYVDSTTWATETVECRLPGDAGVRVRKIQADGITDRTRAWRLGMRQRRIDAYRRKRYSFSTEWDALNSRYLSYCALADDVPGYGQSSILRAISPVLGGYALTLSEPMRWQSGASHVIGLRRPDGTLCGPFPAVRIDDYCAWIAWDLDFDPITDASSTEPTHALFGTSERWSYPALITEITPQGDSVDVTAANYDARIYADDDNSPT